MILLITSILLSLKLTIPHIQIGLFYTLTHKLKASVGKERNFMAKRDAFKFPIVHFPFICNNIPAAPAYGIEIFQLVRYSIACGFYQDFRDIIMVAVNKEATEQRVPSD